MSDVDEARAEGVHPVAGSPRALGVPGAPGVPRERGASSLPADDDAGDARVDEALAGLAGLSTLPLAAHVDAFEGVHSALQARLADTEG